MEKQLKSPQSQVPVQIEPSEAEGIYANLVLIAHSQSEFILDFARMLPGLQRAKVFSRIILTPQTAQSLLRGLEARVKAFETQHGKIHVQGDSTPQRDIGFKTETPYLFFSEWVAGNGRWCDGRDEDFKEGSVGTCFTDPQARPPSG